jgi:hypothetical protein
MHRDEMRRFDGMFCAVRTPADKFSNMLSELTEEQHDLCRAIRYVVFLNINTKVSMVNFCVRYVLCCYKKPHCVFFILRFIVVFTLSIFLR